MYVSTIKVPNEKGFLKNPTRKAAIGEKKYPDFYLPTAPTGTLTFCIPIEQKAHFILIASRYLIKPFKTSSINTALLLWSTSSNRGSKKIWDNRSLWGGVST